MKPRFNLPNREPSKKQFEQVTPLPRVFIARDTGPITREDYARRLTAEKEDTGEIPIISDSLRWTRYSSKYHLAPTTLFFDAARDHLCQTGYPPREMFSCKQLLFLLKADIGSQSQEPYTDIFLFPIYGRAESWPIAVGLDEMISEQLQGETLPINTVICIH